jgi:secreted frizzled-related protein 5
MCVPIPANLSLCHNIGYNKMRLPNLLDHDTMQEVSQQATSWVPLYNIKCHPDTQLFLCSLFAPVCLERPIYPCRSLCQKVKAGCEGLMATYGFPWPSMLDCDKFPLDNDMCIASQSEKETKSIDGEWHLVLVIFRRKMRASFSSSPIKNLLTFDDSHTF